MTLIERGFVMVFPYAALARDNERIGGRKGGGRFRLSDKYRGKKEALNWLAKSQWKALPISGAVAIHGIAHWPDLRTRDLLFFTKALHDALEGVCYADDMQIAIADYVVGAMDRGNPRVEILVTPTRNEWVEARLARGKK